MKRSGLVVVVLLALAVRPAQADFVYYSGGFQNGGLIPDGNESGWADTRSVSGQVGTIAGLSVALTLTGGWNGDLYASLVHNSGFSVLLNRVGSSSGNDTGYGNPGMNVVFNDAGAGGNIHWYGGGSVPTGPYAPDGRNIDPKSGGGTIAGTTPTALLSSFNGLDANGSWTLFISDVLGGDQSRVTQWGLDFELAAVPEPGSLVEGAMAVLFLGGVIGFYRLKRHKLQPAPG
ncbi:MAG TPA: PEP-CTERM sorting domain-containing protein [Candidatus Paceibacterota bacterium]|nr:PEP-CTERM sorting domain-containing protein [Verrucomicrobiota bacterium]HSA09102.1 PEP-CTERM sorting domain-containing protein [Candidatus Paceibacterota bacterium]